MLDATEEQIIDNIHQHGIFVGSFLPSLLRITHPYHVQEMKNQPSLIQAVGTKFSANLRWMADGHDSYEGLIKILLLERSSLNLGHVDSYELKTAAYASPLSEKSQKLQRIRCQ